MVQCTENKVRFQRYIFKINDGCTLFDPFLVLLLNLLFSIHINCLYSKKTRVFKEVAFVIFYDFMDYSILKYFNFKDYTKYTLQKF
jgi:hypothetical protein